MASHDHAVALLPPSASILSLLSLTLSTLPFCSIFSPAAPSFTLSSLLPSPQLVCVLTVLLDRIWIETSAKYMDFPRVAADLQRRVTRLLDRDPVDFGTFAGWLRESQ